MCHVIQETEGRFLWDLSSYCINYCSRLGTQIPPIGVCSCHRITSYHRRTALRDLPSVSKFMIDNYNNNYDDIIDKDEA